MARLRGLIQMLDLLQRRVRAETQALIEQNNTADLTAIAFAALTSAITVVFQISFSLFRAVSRPATCDPLPAHHRLNLTVSDLSERYCRK